jgi:hypothetical protein
MKKATFDKPHFRSINETVKALKKQESAFDKQEGGDHYKDMVMQPFEFLRANNVPHAEGEAICRLLRWHRKGGIEDLRKVIHTVELMIEHEERRSS